MKNRITFLQEKVDIFTNSISQNKITTALIRIYKNIAHQRKEVIACVFLGALLAKIDKLQQFFSSFAAQLTQGEEEWWLLFIIYCSNGLVIFWLSYVFWHKPKNLRYAALNLLFGDRRDVSYSNFYKREGGLWWLAAVASFPVLLCNLTLVLAILGEDSLKTIHSDILKNRGAIFIIASLIYLIIVAYGESKVTFNESKEGKLNDIILKSYQIKRRITILGLVSVILFFGFLFSKYKSIDIEIIKLVIHLVFIFFIPYYLAKFWYLTSFVFFHKKFLDEHQVGRIDNANEWLRRISYCVTIIIFFLSGWTTTAVSKTFNLVFFPFAALLFVFIFYYQILDFVFHNVTKKRVFIFTTLCMTLFFACPSTEHFQVKNYTQTTIGYKDRASIDEYFLAWTKERFEKYHSIPDIYLIAAEGGGSRAGMWTASLLLKLDSATNGKLRENCFAISSVSGGSVGSASALAFWHQMTRNKSNYHGPNALYNYNKTIFGRNYITNGVLGFFIHDFFQQFPILEKAYTTHNCRTDKHQLEENEAITTAINEYFGNQGMTSSEIYLNQGFLDLYYEKNDSSHLKTDLPLFFPNTTRVSDGRRGIISAIKSKDTTFKNCLFPSALDIVQMAGEEDTISPINLSLSSATSLSQLFPYLSSNKKIGKTTGYFIDGGVFENLGLSTLNDIYENINHIVTNPESSLAAYANDKILKDTNFTNSLKKVKIKIVIIKNSKTIEKLEIEKESPWVEFLNPFRAVATTPFSGHTDYAYWRFQKKFNDEHLKVYTYENDSNKVVMSRWLSKTELKSINSRADTIVQRDAQFFGIGK